MIKKIVRRPQVNDQHLPDNLHPLIKQIYARRGVENAAQLQLSATQLIGVEHLLGIEQACKLLHQALLESSKIIIVGDFDADGATSTALMMEALSLLGFRDHSFIVPNRFEYGYGLTPEIVDVAHQQKVDVIITVDNGISCLAGVAHAKALGIKVIVTDHHLPGQQLPNADAIVNPNQPDCTFASKSIAGVGVAFYLMLALRKYFRQQQVFAQTNITEPNLAQLLDLVALGTVADVVSLDANNRILVSQGLKRIRAGKTRYGIQALIEISGRNQQQIVASDFGFALAPRINAAGRLDDISYGINCLLSNDLSAARIMAQELDSLNKTRREIEQGMQQEAEQIFMQLKLDQNEMPSAITLFQRDWHQGVIGIVAGRLKEKFHRPSIVFALAKDHSETNENSEIKGSARSIAGLHIRDLLEHIASQNPDLILKFGGHAMAAGLSLKLKDFARFQQCFQKAATDCLSAEDLQCTLLSDGELAISEMNLAFAEQLRLAGPWGQNFIEPLFDDQFSIIQQRLVGEKHLKLVVQKEQQLFDAIAFNIDTKLWPNFKAQKIQLAYRLDVNEFRGKRNLQLMVEHLELLA
jgi:single-stranded-DNA-specific exonuclease